MNNFIIVLSAYTFGVISGYTIRGFVDKKANQDHSTIVLLSVTLVWALSALVDIVIPSYTTSPLIHGLMGSIVGFFYRSQKKNE